jgi:hypothetical protein
MHFLPARICFKTIAEFLVWAHANVMLHLHRKADASASEVRAARCKPFWCNINARNAQRMVYKQAATVLGIFFKKDTLAEEIKRRQSEMDNESYATEDPWVPESRGDGLNPNLLYPPLLLSQFSQKRLNKCGYF